MWYDISDTYMDNRPEYKIFCPCGHLSVQRQPGSAHASYRYPHSQSETRHEARKYFDGGGLFLYVPTSGSKLWRMAYRYDGKSKLLSFEEYTAQEVANEVFRHASDRLKGQSHDERIEYGRRVV